MKAFSDGAAVKNLPANAEDSIWIPGLQRFPGGGHGYPFQYSRLGNPWTEEPGGQQSMSSKSWTLLATKQHQNPIMHPLFNNIFIL